MAMSKDEILTKLATGDLTTEEASRLLEREERQRRKAKGLHCKVSVKRALSVYGLQRMPVTLYAEQWLEVLDFADSVREFIEEHREQLAWKNKDEE